MIASVEFELTVDIPDSRLWEDDKFDGEMKLFGLDGVNGGEAGGGYCRAYTAWNKFALRRANKRSSVLT